jgi:hypothetical protein
LAERARQRNRPSRLIRVSKEGNKIVTIFVVQDLIQTRKTAQKLQPKGSPHELH